MAWARTPGPICDASFMTPAYIRSLPGRQGNDHSGQNIPKNANDHEQVARLHPALPSYYVVVPTTEPGGLASTSPLERKWGRSAVLQEAVGAGIAAAWQQGERRRRANWPTPISLTTLRPRHPLTNEPAVSKAPASKSAKSGRIFIGVGGWTFEPWRGVFYPEKLAQAKELQYAASKLTSIEINGTYYGSQKPESFRKWAREVPDGFVFSLKGPRFATNRRVLAEAGDSVKRFYDSGVFELGDRLGPVLWQFAPTKKFDEADFGKFLELLPRELEGKRLRHVVEVRHDSFCVPAFVALIRKFETPVVFAEHGKYPAIADVASDFVYARLQKGNDEIKTCYPPKQLDAWARRFQMWAEGGEPDDLPRMDDAKPKKTPRDVFAYVIHEGKIRAPAGAMELIARVS
jgi:uncharacterized protein YecE (DUF72 family)